VRMTPEEVEAVADLARMNLDPGQLERMRSDLGEILESMKALDDADVADVKPLFNPAETDANVTRRDEVVESGIAEQFLASAPEREGDFVVVPRFVGDEEEEHA